MDVLFHIGAPKAGSSTLQTALRLNADALEARGIFAWRPPSRKGDPARALANLFLPPERPLLPIERKKFRTRAETIEWSRACWQDLAAQVRHRRPVLTVLSSEAMMALPHPAMLIDALKEIFRKVTIMAYIRDPADQYRSGIDQLIRGGARMADLPAPPAFWYPLPRTLQRFRDLAGKAGLILRNFDRANLEGGDLVTDFAACIGRLAGQTADFAQRPGQVNESLSAAATIWLLSANETFVRFTDQDDRAALQARNAVIARLRDAASLQGLPALKLDDPQIVAWTRHAARELIGFCNAEFEASGQRLLPAPPPPGELPSADEMQARLHGWLMSQADPAVLSRVVAAVTTATLTRKAA